MRTLLYAGNSEYPTVPKCNNLMGADNQQATKQEGTLAVRSLRD